MFSSVLVHFLGINLVLRSIVSWYTQRIDVRLANSKAGIKPTAPLSAFDKKNSIEFSLDCYTIYTITIVAMHLVSHSSHVHQVIPLSHPVTVTSL